MIEVKIEKKIEKKIEMRKKGRDGQSYKRRRWIKDCRSRLILTE